MSTMSTGRWVSDDAYERFNNSSRKLDEIRAAARRHGHFRCDHPGECLPCKIHKILAPPPRVPQVGDMVRSDRSEFDRQVMQILDGGKTLRLTCEDIGQYPLGVLSPIEWWEVIE